VAVLLKDRKDHFTVTWSRSLEKFMSKYQNNVQKQYIIKFYIGTGSVKTTYKAMVSAMD